MRAPGSLQHKKLSFTRNNYSNHFFNYFFQSTQFADNKNIRLLVNFKLFVSYKSRLRQSSTSIFFSELNIVNLNCCNADLGLLNEYNEDAYIIIQVLCNANNQTCLRSINVICRSFLSIASVQCNNTLIENIMSTEISG